MFSRSSQHRDKHEANVPNGKYITVFNSVIYSIRKGGRIFFFSFPLFFLLLTLFLYSLLRLLFFSLTGKTLIPDLPFFSHYTPFHSCEAMPHICRHPRHARYIYESDGHASRSIDLAQTEGTSQSLSSIRPFHRPRPLSPPGWFAANV